MDIYVIRSIRSPIDYLSIMNLFFFIWKIFNHMFKTYSIYPNKSLNTIFVLNMYV